jgi:hypothetical protein
VGHSGNSPSHLPHRFAHTVTAPSTREKLRAELQKVVSQTAILEERLAGLEKTCIGQVEFGRELDNLRQEQHRDIETLQEITDAWVPKAQWQRRTTRALVRRIEEAMDSEGDKQTRGPSHTAEDDTVGGIPRVGRPIRADQDGSESSMVGPGPIGGGGFAVVRGVLPGAKRLEPTGLSEDIRLSDALAKEVLPALVREFEATHQEGDMVIRASQPLLATIPGASGSPEVAASEKAGCTLGDVEVYRGDNSACSSDPPIASSDKIS